MPGLASSIEANIGSRTESLAKLNQESQNPNNLYRLGSFVLFFSGHIFSEPSIFRVLFSE